ncbi:unnamed protein product [Absidia cylindrospora]
MAHISAAGLDVVARFCVHLSWLGLAHTPISLATLRTLDHRFWKYLDIAYCDRLHQDINTIPYQQQQQQQQQQRHYDDDILAPSATTTKSHKSLYELIICAPQLQHLSLSMPVLQHLLAVHRRQPNNNVLVNVDVDDAPAHYLPRSPSQVDRLVIHNLPEHTPLSMLDDLAALFPKVKHLKLVRDYYQTDYLHLSFSPGDNQGNQGKKTHHGAVITEETIKSYRPVASASLMSIVMEQRRDLLEGPSMW